MNLKTRLFAGAGALALVGSIAAVAIPASATPTPTVVGACTGAESVAGIKTADGLGLDNTLKVVKISVKSIAAQTMTCSGLAATDGAVAASSLKASVGNGTTSQASCDTSLVSTALPPTGKIGWVQGIAKEQGYVRFAGSDPAINYYVDTVSVHGFMTKGDLAGTDLDGGLWQNPTVKDKTAGPGFGGFTTALGLDLNPGDSFFIGASCQLGVSAADLAFNNGLGGVKGPVAAPTHILTVITGDGPSLIEPLIPPASAGKNGACPCVQAPGLVFSVF